MAAVYMTPGVYVEEIPKFPPSIAPVETAIPAFIGYTEKAIRNGESLTNKPTRIESIAEYEEIFGVGPSQNVEVFLDNDNNFVRGQATSTLYLYDSLRMFYANGGGKCFIVSVGSYPEPGFDKTAIANGLPELEKEDEPTIILMPDAVSTIINPGSIDPGLYDLQQVALAQCNKLMDRVVICDLLKATDFTAFGKTVDDFRNAIGINSLKYGAAYGPWIHANLPRQIWRKNLLLKREGTNSDIPLESLTTDVGILNLIRDIKLAETGAAALTNGVTAVISAITGAADKTLNDALQKILDDYKQTSDIVGDLSAALQRFTNLTFDILNTIQAVNVTVYPPDTQFKITNSISDYLVNSTLKDSILALAAHHEHLAGVVAPPISNVIDTGSTKFAASANLLGFNDGNALLDAVPPPDITDQYPASVDTSKKIADVASNAAYSAALNAITMFNSIQTSAHEFEKSLNDALVVAFGKFKELVTKGAEALNLLPPSGAVAGVYASVDRDRGVWKAPANVSLNSVISPAVKISHEQQGEYNVDVNAGKSINIIRAFTGKGTLVWGARTLAGNDNEWRYVNVRRFFNFVEESTKKATEQFVFEPNDANTWVKVQAMIENFLTVLWRQGALQGVKPEHAFYVAVGLGKTMTPLDILEGRMIVEIGMAAVRPAEFIILRFSHKMAES